MPPFIFLRALAIGRRRFTRARRKSEKSGVTVLSFVLSFLWISCFPRPVFSFFWRPNLTRTTNSSSAQIGLMKAQNSTKKKISTDFISWPSSSTSRGNDRPASRRFAYQSSFLDAPSHLYKRVCPSVCSSVRPSVRPSPVDFRCVLGTSCAVYPALFIYHENFCGSLNVLERESLSVYQTGYLALKP